MKKYLVLCLAFVLVISLSVNVYILKAQTPVSGQARISVDNRGLKAQVEALETLVAAQQITIDSLVAKQATIVTVDIHTLQVHNEQLMAQRIEEAAQSSTHKIWVCAPSEPTGEKQITRDEYLANVDALIAKQVAQIIALEE